MVLRQSNMRDANQASRSSPDLSIARMGPFQHGQRLSFSLRTVAPPNKNDRS
jgi:hypothetical protein